MGAVPLPTMFEYQLNIVAELLTVLLLHVVLTRYHINKTFSDLT